MVIAGCLIVKNESKIITRCLDSIKNLIGFLYVQDTGSSDNTLEVIKEWASKNRIDMDCDILPFKDFAFNRTKALERLRQISHVDYVLLIDADEVLDIKAELPELNKDFYYVTCRYGTIEYLRPFLINNKKQFEYKGVLHEFIDYKGTFTKEIINDIYNIPFNDGSRSNDKIKFIKDALLLEDAIKREDDFFLKSRYTFYCAQSYKDCGEYNKSLEKYSLRTKQGGWFQEIYISYLNEGRLKQILGVAEDSILGSFLNGIDIDPYRAECYYEAGKACRLSKKFNLAYFLISAGLNCKLSNSNLFSEPDAYRWRMMDEYSLACFYTSRFNEGYSAIKKCLEIAPESEKNRLRQNLLFFPVNHS
jgi:glycosyltransferase involved in cell wall biosynthesis